MRSLEFWLKAVFPADLDIHQTAAKFVLCILNLRAVLALLTDRATVRLHSLKTGQQPRNDCILTS